MSIAFESDGKLVSNRQFLLRGIAFLIVVAAAAAVLLAKSEGAFDKSVRVTAALVNVGDGLPPKSDVKYQGVLVGLVNSVDPAVDGGPNYVRIDLMPRYASAIPATVTARVVPSNVFAVPSVQLVDNGPGPWLAPGAQIPEDHSLATVRLQTSLTALNRIVAAVGRPADDPGVGLLSMIEQATSGRSAEAVRAATQLDQLARALNQAMAPDGTASTLSALATGLDGLRSSSPDLLAALHAAVVPLRAIAREKQQLTDLLSGGLVTTGTVGTALQHNTGTILDITGKMGPVMDLMAQGGRGFVQMTTSMTRLTLKFQKQFWRPAGQNSVANIIVELTPHHAYTRADCPRYGALLAPSCATAPVGPPAIPSSGASTPSVAGSVKPIDLGGNVGQAGSRQEQAQIGSLFGVGSNSASDLLAGPLLRDNDITAEPAARTSASTGGQ
jgi:ABC-type transporter Mla subunit MlaD